MRRLPTILTVITILTVSAILSVSSPVFAQDDPAPAPDRLEQRRQNLENRRAEVEARRSDRQSQIIEKIKQKLTEVIDRLGRIAVSAQNHIDRIRARAERLAANQGADISAVVSALDEAEKHIGLAQQGIADLKLKLSQLDTTEAPRDVVQIFRTGIQSVRSHFKEARANLVSALKVLRDAAKESRPTGAAEE